MIPFGQKALAFFKRHRPIGREADVEELMDMIRAQMLETKVMSAILANFIAYQAKAANDKEAWLRAFSGDVHASINLIDPQGVVQAEIEEMRIRVDDFMKAAALLPVPK